MVGSKIPKQPPFTGVVFPIVNKIAGSGAQMVNGLLMSTLGPRGVPYTGIFQGKKYKEGKTIDGSLNKEPITSDMPVTGDASMPTGTPANPPAVPKEVLPPPAVQQASIGGADLKTVAMIAVPLIVLGLILRR